VVKKKILILTDYKGHFGSKHFDIPYRSGMDKVLLKDLFNLKGFDIEFEQFSQVDLRNTIKYKNSIILYTSSEDIGYHYKSYIEDVIFALSEIGANVVPSNKFMRANNNKVFMEFLRTSILNDDKFYSHHFGSLKDLLPVIDKLEFPLVFKTAEGAAAAGVALAKNKKELISIVKKNKTYNYLFEDIKEYFRSWRHKGYKRESIYRNKFILQPFIPNLKNDWKVLIFGNKYFVLSRGVRENDFRASGSKTNYKTDIDAAIPSGMLDYCMKIMSLLDVPHLSVDLMYDGNRFYLTEFQAIYFGTSTVNMSKNYFQLDGKTWNSFPISYNIEELYVESIINYIQSATI
jgi:glutathione synthase/RimK-type ligase-like ATP-grasp enzyme